MSKKNILIVIVIIILGGIGCFVYKSKIEESANKGIQKLFVDKYPNYAETLSVNIDKETKNYVRGSVNFVVGAPGGLFLAVKSDDKWQIVHEGNGQIPCSLSDYGFPSDMLLDCILEQNFVADAQNATYIIEGEEFTLVNGKSEKEIAPDSVLKIITQYFGNEVRADFNGDDIEDVAFLLTQNSGGSGMFYYLAVLLSNEKGFVGTDAIFIGDRIAPQNNEYMNDMIIVNYADRKAEEPFSVQPSVGVSKYFKIIDSEIVEISLEMGEVEARAIAEKLCIKSGESLSIGTYNENSKTWWFDVNLNSTKPGCNPACVVSEVTKTAEINWRCTRLI